jgi:signal transduction histidine kinase
MGSRGGLTGWFRKWYDRAADNVATAPIVARVLGAIGVLAILVAAAFVFVLVALSNLRGSTNEQVAANRVTTAALRLERVVDELDQSLRGVVLTGNSAIRANWEAARRSLAPAIIALEKQADSQHREVPLVRSVAVQARQYVSDYGNPILQIAAEDPAAARSQTTSHEGILRIGQLRGDLARLLADEDRLVSSHASSSRHRASQAVLIGGIALATSGFLLLLVSGYLVRAVARPVRIVASGASRIAAGDLSTRIPEAGPAEIRELTTAFNTMAESVEHGRRELEVQNEQLRQSERAKSELITIVSHELRTPLSSILGYTRLMLKRDTDQGTLRRYVEIIHDQGERLAGLIEGFLAAEDRNGTGIELTPEVVDLGALVRREVELIASDSPDHDLSVTVDQKPLTVHADGERLAQVVINLVTNAVKYSPSGGAIRVEVRRHGDTIRASVQDEGLGIASEHQSRVFSKFFRGEARASGIPGVGLGLALSREIVEAHGGRIDFTSVENKGSTFWFDLPAYEQESAGRPLKGVSGLAR